MTNKADLGEALAKIDLSAYLDMQGVEYRESHGSSGLQLNLKECPSCGDGRWKVFMNAEKALGNCFVCDTKFNFFRFIQAHTALDNKKTAAHIFKVAEEMGWRQPRKSTVAVNTNVKELVLPKSYRLPINGKNLSYLENRRITTDIAEYMHLRYCHNGLFRYTAHDGSKGIQDYSNRIIIPVFDLGGEMISFQGRDITGTAEKKYLFPNGFAATGTAIYNGHNVHNTKRIVIGEGVFDVAALKIAMDSEPDLRDVIPVGTFGKHLSFGHENSQLAKFLTLYDRGVRDIVIMWDGEVKATDDAIEAGRMLKNVGFNVRIGLLPEGRDPNEVAPSVVCATYYKAVPVTNTNAIKLKMLRRVA